MASDRKPIMQIGLRLVIALFVLYLAVAHGTPSGSLRYAYDTHFQRITIESDRPFAYQVAMARDPGRLIVTLPDRRIASVPAPSGQQSVLAGVSQTAYGERGMRLAFDLLQTVKPKVVVLPAQPPHGHRLVIELYPTQPQTAAVTAAARKATATAAAVPAARQPAQRDAVVVIDAGHGGKDTGAIGPRGTREKDVVLAIARRLARMIDAEPGMRAVLTRTNDEFLSLRKRMNLARTVQADLFVSLHADAFPDGRARGSSVFVLSNTGASSEAARVLAERENAADLVGGLSLADKDEHLAEVLLDLSQSATADASHEAARLVLKQIDALGDLHHHRVQEAGFVVLKAPDVPSILVETAFISNSEEEALLRSAAHQKKLAQGLLHGIRAYLMLRAPEGTRLAAR